MNIEHIVNDIQIDWFSRNLDRLSAFDVTIQTFIARYTISNVTKTVKYTDQSVAYLEFHEGEGKYSLATSAQTKGGMFSYFTYGEQNIWSKGHGPMPTLNTPLKPVNIDKI